MIPDPELLRVEYLSLAARHDDVDLPRDEVAAFFAAAGERYGLTRLELEPEGGATLTGPGSVEFVLRPGRLASGTATAFGYREGAERAVGLAQEASARFGVGELWLDDVTLVAIWDCGDPEAVRAILSDGVAGAGAERLEVLGGDEVSVGLRIWRRRGERSTECALEPVHSDPSRIYVRLIEAQVEPLEGAAELIEVADEVRDFLYGPLADFVLAACRR